MDTIQLSKGDKGLAEELEQWLIDLGLICC